MSACLLTLIAIPELEERLVDWLLEEGHGGFTTLPCHGHGVSHEHLSAAEQVAGRQRQVAFLLQVSETSASDIVRKLAAAFGDSEIHFWTVPVTAAGPISGAA